jgi:hypothetical protein
VSCAGEQRNHGAVACQDDAGEPQQVLDLTRLHPGFDIGTDEVQLCVEFRLERVEARSTASTPALWFKND